MPKVHEYPATRADEIRRARGLGHPEVTLRGNIHRSTVSRILNGQVKITPGLALRMARALECEVKDIFDPLGTVIPPRKSLAFADRTADDALNGTGYMRRSHALALALGMSHDAMMRYLVYGDFSLMPDSLAQRIHQMFDDTPAVPQAPKKAA